MRKEDNITSPKITTPTAMSFRRLSQMKSCTDNLNDSKYAERKQRIKFLKKNTTSE